jgi:cytochrome c-type biogenesis protein
VSDFGFLQLVLLPLALGLLGFVEPCSLGTTVLFVKYLDAQSAPAKIAQTLFFALTRAGVIGALGAAAAVVGSAFVPYQKGAWIVLGIVYVILGAVLAADRAQWLARALGPPAAVLSGTRGSVALGVLFGLNIPACAAPLLAALLALAAATGASGATLTRGFVSLALFGLALSLPLVAVVFIARARRLLDSAVRHASRYPRWAGFILIVLGVWSIRFGWVADVGLQ